MMQYETVFMLQEFIQYYFKFIRNNTKLNSKFLFYRMLFIFVNIDCRNSNNFKADSSQIKLKKENKNTI